MAGNGNANGETVKFRVSFTGACALVEDSGPTKRVRVLLANGCNGHGGANGNGGAAHATRGELMEMYSLLRFQRADLHPESPRQPDAAFRPATPRAKDALCYVYQEDLAVGVRADELVTRSLNLENALMSVEDPPTVPDEGNRRDLYWVADLAQIAQFTEGVQMQLQPGCLAADPKGPITARFDLDAGVLFTEEFVRTFDRFGAERTGPVQVASFVDGDKTLKLKRAIAARVACDLEVATGSVVRLESRRWNGERGPALWFGPLTRDTSVEVWNVPFHDVLDDLYGASAPVLKASPQGGSFMHFYSLVDNADQLAERFVPTEYELGPDLPAVANGKGAACGPSRLGQWALANIFIAPTHGH
jgi:hypothetical protein